MGKHSPPPFSLAFVGGGSLCLATPPAGLADAGRDEAFLECGLGRVAGAEAVSATAVGRSFLVAFVAGVPLGGGGDESAVPLDLRVWPRGTSASADCAYLGVTAKERAERDSLLLAWSYSALRWRL